MNPFTKFLNQWSSNRGLTEFVTHWDLLESVMVQVYRQKMSPEEAQAPFDQAWPWLRQHYQRWTEKLRPYWMQTRSGGKPTECDPFQLLLDLKSPQDIIGNWNAMQHLPSAREALNHFILEQQ